MSVIGTEAQKIFRTFNLTESEKKDVRVIREKIHGALHAAHKSRLLTLQVLNLMAQKEGEAFTDYVTAARLQASKCNYGSLTEELLRELLTEPALDLEKAIHLCRANARAAQQMEDMTTQGTQKFDALRQSITMKRITMKTSLTDKSDV